MSILCASWYILLNEDFFSLLIKTIKFGDEKINESLSKYDSYYWEFQVSKFS